MPTNLRRQPNGQVKADDQRLTAGRDPCSSLPPLSVRDRDRASCHAQQAEHQGRDGQCQHSTDQARDGPLVAVAYFRLLRHSRLVDTPLWSGRHIIPPLAVDQNPGLKLVLRPVLQGRPLVENLRAYQGRGPDDSHAHQPEF